jgi:hypothetical protein
MHAGCLHTCVKMFCVCPFVCKQMFWDRHAVPHQRTQPSPDVTALHHGRPDQGATILLGSCKHVQKNWFGRKNSRLSGRIRTLT